MKGKLLEVKTIEEPPKYESFPYAKKPILTSTEKAFFKKLEIALENKFFIFPQMALNRFLQKANHINKKDWDYNYFNQIKAKTVDFVIYDKENLDLLLIIELDDESHNSSKKIKRDTFVNDTLTEVGYNVLRLNNDHTPKEIKKLIYTNFRIEDKEMIELQEELKTGIVKKETPEYLPRKDSIPPITKHDYIKVTTYQIAKNHCINTAEVIKRLLEKGYLTQEGEQQRLSDEGKKAGGEKRVSQKNIQYFLWPKDIMIDRCTSPDCNEILKVVTIKEKKYIQCNKCKTADPFEEARV